MIDFQEKHMFKGMHVNRPISFQLILFLLLFCSFKGYAVHHDPTMPVNVAMSQKGALSSILFSKKRRTAVYNNHIFLEGEEWKGIKVIKINPDRITVEHDEKFKDIQLYHQK